MQYHHIFSIIYCIFSLSFLFAQETRPINKILPSSNQAKALQISLLTDRRSYSIGDEIHFEITFFNNGNSPFRILIDDTFVGEHIMFINMQGETYSYEGGYNSWSPKAGVFTGRTYLLKPNSRIVIKMDALVYDNYRLVFSNLFDREGGDNYQELKKRNKLPRSFPDKYICAGRIIPLLKADKYRLKYIYETSDADKHWKFVTKKPQESSVDLLWIGEATSNTIEISIQ